MAGPLTTQGIAGRLKREWRLRNFKSVEFRHLLDPSPENEWVSLACEVTGHDPNTDQVIGISAVRVNGHRVLGSQRLELLLRPQRPLVHDGIRSHRLRRQDLEQGLDSEAAIRSLLHFVGSRPLLGYYLDFDLAMLEPLVRPLLGMGLPQEAIEVSALYYGYQFKRLPTFQQQEGAKIDLRLDMLLTGLGLPLREGANALDRAVLVGLAFIRLRQLGAA